MERANTDQGSMHHDDLPRRTVIDPPSQPWLFEALERRPQVLRILVPLTVLLVSLLMIRQWRTSGVSADLSVGAIAPRDIVLKSHHPRRFVDTAQTELNQERNAQRVPRVFVYREDILDRIARKSAEAFKTARVQWQEARLQRRRDGAAAAIEAFMAAVQVPLSQASQETLKDSRFSSIIQELADRTIQSALSQPLLDASVLSETDYQNKISIVYAKTFGQRVVNPAALHRMDALPKELPREFDRLAQWTLGPQRGAFDDYRALRDAVCELVLLMVEPSVVLDEKATLVAREQAREKTPLVSYTYRVGEVIVKEGESIKPSTEVVLRALSKPSDAFVWIAPLLGAFITIGSLIWVSASLRRRRKPTQARDLVFLALAFIFSIGMLRLWVPVSEVLSIAFPVLGANALLFLVPVAAGAMVVRLVIDRESALIFAVASSVALGLIYQEHTFWMLYALLGAATGATLIRRISSRFDLVFIGARIGLLQTIVVLGLMLYQKESLSSVYILNLAAAAFSGLLSSALALFLTPILEAIFGYTTDLKLLELANLNHPALKELIVQAPGTYHHSVIVGSLVEAAAEQIGANSLLARVMAYYHDLGKGCNAMYFIENQRAGHNPHNKLKPHMSAMILRRHVTDGLRLAKKYNLGESILAGIAEHHGTTLMQYFFARAKEQEDPDSPVQESDFRYNGRKPQTRESALVMLGDSVEAACRSLKEPTVPRLQGMVNKVINTKFTDGQLEECDLTLKNLHVIAKSFMRILKSIYHQRVEYPELKQPKPERSEEVAKERVKPIQGVGSHESKVMTKESQERAVTGPSASKVRSTAARNEGDGHQLSEGLSSDSVKASGSKDEDSEHTHRDQMSGADIAEGDPDDDPHTNLRRLGLS